MISGNYLVKKAYENYCVVYEKDNRVGLTMLVQRIDDRAVYRKPDIEMFIGLCTHDESFSEKWGLKIEERDLTDEEAIFAYERHMYSPMRILDQKFVEVPTKLITISYNNQIEKIYA